MTMLPVRFESTSTTTSPQSPPRPPPNAVPNPEMPEKYARRREKTNAPEMDTRNVRSQLIFSLSYRSLYEHADSR